MGSNLFACLWIYTKAVLCDGRRRDPPLDLESILGIIVESVNWVTEGSLWEHEWITVTNVTFKENEKLEALDYEIDVPAHCSGDYCGSQHRQTSTASSSTMERK